MHWIGGIVRDERRRGGGRDGDGTVGCIGIVAACHLIVWGRGKDLGSSCRVTRRREKVADASLLSNSWFPLWVGQGARVRDPGGAGWQVG